jgi:hypothetical protein
MIQSPPNGVVQLVNFTNDDQVTIKNGFELGHNGYNYGTVKSNVKVFSGQWYYEVKIKQGSSGRVGWCTDKFNVESKYVTLGNDEESYAFDGSRKVRCYNEKDGKSDSYGDYWAVGDVIGCLLDADAKKISFYRNGKDLGVAFNAVKIDQGLVPAGGVYRGTVFEYNFTRKWTHPVKFAAPLQFNLSANEIKNLTAVFDKYFAVGVKMSESGNTGEVIKGMGLLELGQELGSQGDYDPLLLILAWKLHCGTVWEIQKEEWLNGFQIHGVSTFDQIKAKIQEWRGELKDETQFKSLYNFIYEYLKPEKATALDKEEALLAWKMLDMNQRWKFWDKWESYLTQATDKKSITRDTWQMLLSFIDQIGTDVSTYDPMDCWPSAIDDFVEWVKEN